MRPIDRTRVVVFDYYHRLKPAQQAIYRRSDTLTYVALPRVRSLGRRVQALQQSLKAGRREQVARDARTLLDELTAALGVARVRVKVLAARPHDDWGELHGLYEAGEGRRLACITLWMRTAKRRQIVAFRTFLRTLLHELCHHLDYRLYRLADSYHTEGFYQREASLMRQLLPAKARAARARASGT